jgi:hypothetical protein
MTVCAAADRAEFGAWVAVGSVRPAGACAAGLLADEPQAAAATAVATASSARGIARILSMLCISSPYLDSDL